MTFAISRVGADDVRPMRHAVLRSHQPYDAVRYPHDDDPETGHFAAYDDQGTLVGIATAMHQPLPETAAPDGGTTWRLRGMATAEAIRGTGTGGLLLQAVVDHAKAHGGTLIWCNARSDAVWFYERYGWVKVSDEFEDTDAGAHFRMTCQLRSTSGSM